jgi:hypothetical protein
MTGGARLPMPARTAIDPFVDVLLNKPHRGLVFYEVLLRRVVAGRYGVKSCLVKSYEHLRFLDLDLNNVQR